MLCCYENFKDVLSKPRLKTLAVIAIAISLAEKLKINEIARHLPVDVSHRSANRPELISDIGKGLAQ